MPARSKAAASGAPVRLLFAGAPVLFAGALLVLAGCQSLRPPAPAGPAVVVPWPERRSALQARARFEARGRVAVAVGSEGFNGRLHWLQEETRSTVSLEGPLGVGGLRVVLDGPALSLTDAAGAELDSEAARGELDRRLGFDPPLASLRYWLQGVPDPAFPAEETTDVLPRLAALSQEGWTIAYPGYLATPGGWLPRRITLQRGTVRVRLVLDGWYGATSAS